MGIEGRAASRGKGIIATRSTANIIYISGTIINVIGLKFYQENRLNQDGRLADQRCAAR